MYTITIMDVVKYFLINWNDYIWYYLEILLETYVTINYVRGKLWIS